jgi:hypothetical protein
MQEVELEEVYMSSSHQGLSSTNFDREEHPQSTDHIAMASTQIDVGRSEARSTSTKSMDSKTSKVAAPVEVQVAAPVEASVEVPVEASVEASVEDVANDSSAVPVSVDAEEDYDLSLSAVSSVPPESAAQVEISDEISDAPTSSTNITRDVTFEVEEGELDAALAAALSSVDSALDIAIVDSEAPAGAPLPMPPVGDEDEDVSEISLQPSPASAPIDEDFLREQSHIEIDFDDEEDDDETNSPGAVLSGAPRELEAEPATQNPEGMPPINGGEAARES